MRDQVEPHNEYDLIKVVRNSISISEIEQALSNIYDVDNLRAIVLDKRAIQGTRVKALARLKTVQGPSLEIDQLAYDLFLDKLDNWVKAWIIPIITEESVLWKIATSCDDVDLSIAAFSRLCHISPETENALKNIHSKDKGTILQTVHALLPLLSADRNAAMCFWRFLTKICTHSDSIAIDKKRPHADYSSDCGHGDVPNNVHTDIGIEYQLPPYPFQDKE